MDKKHFVIRAEWDNEALVWVAVSDDVPGLATESDTLENLVCKLKSLIPELLMANGLDQPREAHFELLSRRFEAVQEIAV